MKLTSALGSCQLPKVTIAAIAIILLAATASAQYTAVGLYTYPNTDNNTSGITANSFLAQGPDGEFYDTDWSNGKYNSGSVYTMSLSGDYALLYSFCAEGGNCLVTGSGPGGGVALGSDGNFYGTTSYGGTGLAGTVFKITPAGKLTTLYSFPSDTSEGANPTFPVFEATNGDFYGVTPAGGANGNGVLFRITSGGKYALVASFRNLVNGYNPNLPAEGTDGNFYGTTHNGGPNSACCGTIYKSTAAGKVTVLYTFPGGQGSPVGQLVQSADGNFWGVTNGVPFESCGELFKVSSSGDFAVVQTFGGTVDVCNAVSGLIVGSDGYLYGVTPAGGSANYGAVYRVDPSTGDLALLYSFCSGTGCVFYSPQPVLAQNTNGTFYGNTSGSSDGGSDFYSLDTGLGPFVRTVAQSGKVGATVDFFGQDFTDTTGVEFDGVEATFKVISGSELSAVVPAAAVTGLVSVVTSSNGTFTALSKFKVMPTAKSFTPTSGPVGTSVTITGTGLTGATKVTIDGKSATFTVNSSTKITATVPTSAATGKVAVTTGGGSASAPGTFTVTD
jgi:uncharacterized repeat protein (TIGR03803 family)